MKKIIIKNLGPVKEFEMDVNSFNLLIGEQATGKSTIAKCMYFFRTIKTHLTYYFQYLYDTGSYFGHDISKGFDKNLKKELKSVFISLFGFSWDLDNELYLKYFYTKENWIDVLLSKKYKKHLSIRFSKSMRKELECLEKYIIDLHKQKVLEHTTIPSLDYGRHERLNKHKEIKDKVNEIFDDPYETYYIPAGRGMITLLASNRAGINIQNLDLVTRQFMQLIESIYNSFTDGIYNAHKFYADGNRPFDVSVLSKRIVQNLKGDYRHSQDNKEYLVLDGGKQIPINFASSGQQEVLWLLNLLYILMLKKESAFVIIEEPEAHLYPSLQQEIISFIAFFSNINKSSVFITTHSPYVLTAANIYYYAGKIMQAFSNAPSSTKNTLKKEIYTIIERNRELSPKSFSAFKLNKDHSVQSLIHEEFGEIASELIDETSENNSNRYMELFNLSEKYSRLGEKKNDKKEKE